MKLFGLVIMLLVDLIYDVRVAVLTIMLSLLAIVGIGYWLSLVECANAFQRVMQ